MRCVDISLRRVLQWTSPATLGFDNSRRQSANRSELSFSSKAETITLPYGIYLVEINETVQIPPDCMGQVSVRSSLWHSAVLLTARAPICATRVLSALFLDVKIPHSTILCKNVKLGQVALHLVRRSQSILSEHSGWDGLATSTSDPVA